MFTSAHYKSISVPTTQLPHASSWTGLLPCGQTAMLPPSGLVKIESKQRKEPLDGIPKNGTEVGLHVSGKNKKVKSGTAGKIKDENSKVSKDSMKKGPIASLTEEQKKANHILSETRRRNLIRSTYDRLVELVPQLEESEKRAEHTVMTKTAAYIIELRKENERLEKLKSDRGL